MCRVINESHNLHIVLYFLLLFHKEREILLQKKQREIERFACSYKIFFVSFQQHAFFAPFFCLYFFFIDKDLQILSVIRIHILHGFFMVINHTVCIPFHKNLILSGTTLISHSHTSKLNNLSLFFSFH